MSEHIHLEAIIPESLHGQRLDKALVTLFPDYSRARLQQWIKSKQVHVNGACKRAKDPVVHGEQILVDAILVASEAWTAEDIALDVLYADTALIVINKPAGLVVHPGAGNQQGTLLNALLKYDPSLAQLPRAGIVHRLDKETSGIMVVARTLEAHTYLVQAIANREVKREYQAVVHGPMVAGGTVDTLMNRHPRNRTHMAVSQYNGQTSSDALSSFAAISATYTLVTAIGNRSHTSDSGTYGPYSSPHRRRPNLR